MESARDLLVLHAVRLKGMANDDQVAARFDLDPVLAAELLLDFQAVGWLSRFEFAGTAGWALTDSGRAANERQLAGELVLSNAASSVRAAYAAFLPHNDQLLRACTDWQLRPTGTGPLAANGHTDPDWDQQVLRTLSPLSEELRTLARALGGRLARFQGYSDRFRGPSAARSRATTPGWPGPGSTPVTRSGWNCPRTWSPPWASSAARSQPVASVGESAALGLDNQAR